MDQSPWAPQTPALVASELLAQNAVVVLHFWAVWNLLDRRMDAFLQEIRPQFAGRIAFYAVDLDERSNDSLIRQCQIVNIPALACFLHGQWHHTSIGLRSTADLAIKLESWLSQADDVP